MEEQLRQLASNMARGMGVGHDEMHKFRREVMAAVDGKADGKHVAALVDQKVSVADMNDALARLSDAINTNTATAAANTVDPTSIEALAAELQSLHQRVGAELLCGRWIWKSGQMAGPPSAGVSQPGELVPWNIECTNANPSVFRWVADASSVGCDLPGLYELRVGMFTDKQPRVTILVNGHTVFTTPTPDQLGAGGGPEKGLLGQQHRRSRCGRRRGGDASHEYGHVIRRPCTRRRRADHSQQHRDLECSHVP